MSGPVRSAAAAFLAILILATGVMPHVHEGQLGRHACVACVAAGGEAHGAAPELAPPRPVFAEPAPSAPEAPVTGAPLGAVPGQSPPPRA